MNAAHFYTISTQRDALNPKLFVVVFVVAEQKDFLNKLII